MTDDLRQLLQDTEAAEKAARDFAGRLAYLNDLTRTIANAPDPAARQLYTREFNRRIAEADDGFRQLLNTGTANENFYEIAQFGRDLARFEAARQLFSYRTFGPASFKGPLGPLRHMAKEVGEAIEMEEGDDEDLTEYADLFLLLLDAWARKGLSLGDLLAMAETKLEVLKKRSWPDWRGTDPDQPIEHDRSNDAAS